MLRDGLSAIVKQGHRHTFIQRPRSVGASASGKFSTGDSEAVLDGLGVFPVILGSDIT